MARSPHWGPAPDPIRRTAAEEWALDYGAFHARPGTRSALLTAKGGRILQMLAPYPWEPDAHGISFAREGERVRVTWEPEQDSFVVGHAHSAPSTGFPSGDAKRILDAFREFHGSSRSRALQEPGYRRTRQSMASSAADRQCPTCKAWFLSKAQRDAHIAAKHRSVAVDWEPSREVKGQQGTMVLGGGEGLGLFRRSLRRRYRNR